MGTKTTFTNAKFVRSHGRNPSGCGTWAFQQATTDQAFTLTGEIVFAPMLLTLGEAKRWMRQQGNTGLWAVMP